MWFLLLPFAGVGALAYTALVWHNQTKPKKSATVAEASVSTKK